ncbi:M43 family zinc metalloprotease [Sporosarcina limicola]|uniref:Peptidase M43 pregnancy-associated plasma-A domain-containing protein n=1 Tax=Sporosarcina limicola TaxID=34101 RepID=A0A927MLH0_9BACL|nr:M43 family zinc metalloprotease [Sporosarcina limicola]MBE1556555.1 hypothetical protein [Sporosarcina limicola]
MWIVNCSNHAGTTSYTYNFEIGLGNEYKGYTYNGLLRWNGTNEVSIIQNPISQNIVKSHGGPDTSTVAKTTSWANSTTGHKTRWEISYNRYLMGNRTTDQNNSTATHELGHTIGLSDLYNSTNKNKVMYGVGDRTVHTPSSYDIAGAREAVK